MNIQDMINLPALNNLQQQSQHPGALNAQIQELVTALHRFGLDEVADWITEKTTASAPSQTVPNSVVDHIPQQSPSEADFSRQAMAARVIANKLGLYDAADHLKRLL